MELLDIKKNKKRSKRRYVLHITLISLLSILVIAGSVLSLIFSSLDYQINLLANIIIDSLYVVFMVFYFLNIFPIVKRYYRLYKGMSGVSIEHRRKMTFVEQRENKVMDNIIFKVMNFSYQEGENTYQESLYILDNEIPFESGKSYALDVYQNIIVSTKEINNATL